MPHYTSISFRQNNVYATANSSVFYRQEVRNAKGIKQTESNNLKGSLSILYSGRLCLHMCISLMSTVYAIHN
jgi:hypothetical protein